MDAKSDLITFPRALDVRNRRDQFSFPWKIKFRPKILKIKKVMLKKLFEIFDFLKYSENWRKIFFPSEFCSKKIFFSEGKIFFPSDFFSDFFLKISKKSKISKCFFNITFLIFNIFGRNFVFRGNENNYVGSVPHV